MSHLQSSDELSFSRNTFPQCAHQPTRCLCDFTYYYALRHFLDKAGSNLLVVNLEEVIPQIEFLLSCRFCLW